MQPSQKLQYIIKNFSSSDNESEIKNSIGKNYLRQPIKRFSYPFISKFEKAKLLGVRAKQISNGNPPTVPLEGETDPLLIALKEYRENKIPLKIRRYFSDVMKIFVWELADIN